MSESNSWTSALVQLLPMAAVAGLSIAGYHLAITGRAEASGGRPVTEIVVVDTQALVQGKIDLASEQIASGQTFTEEQLTMQGQNFGTELLRALKEYRDRGVLVIDRRHALAIPVGSDVTQEVAARLGVTAKPSTDPFSAPAFD
jgi:hypothetical protein